MFERPLVIVDRTPLPAVTGGRQRLWNFLLAVDALGPSDLVILDKRSDEGARLLTESLPNWTVHFVPLRLRRQSKFERIARTLRAREPYSLMRTDVDAAAEEIKPLVGDRPLVLAIQPRAAIVARRIAGRAPIVVDRWDIDDVRIERELAHRSGRWALAPREIWNETRARCDVRAWSRFKAELADYASVVTVCSEADRRASSTHPSVWVVPNGAEITSPSPRSPDDHPTILFHGQLTYPPNADAAEMLVDRVEPLVRSRIPDLRVRIVGRTDKRVQRLRRPPHVEVTGFVDDIDEELARAWILVVPLLDGGGTRLKILEAFASGLPVVSTPVGAGGLDVEHDRHLLIAEGRSELAAAAIHLLRHSGERTRLADAAAVLVEERYDWRAIRSELTMRLNDLIANSHTSRRGEGHRGTDSSIPGPSDP